MKMNFKDIIKSDVSNVFINFDEFAEKRVIDGKDMMVVVDNNELIEREQGRSQNSYIEGIYKKKLLLYVQADDMERLPAIGRLMTVDDELFRVIDAVDEMGVYSISLEVYEH